MHNNTDVSSARRVVASIAGNVLEWCHDYWSSAYPDYPTPITDPAGPTSGTFRTARGGGWGSDGNGCWTAWRTNNFPGVISEYVGFRLARSPNP